MNGGAAGSSALSRATTSELTHDLRLGVDESHGGTGNDLVSGLVTDVVGQRLLVGGDEDSDGTVDVGNNASVEGEDDGERCASKEHLTEERLENKRNFSFG